jgi:hypothetical protein
MRSQNKFANIRQEGICTNEEGKEKRYFLNKPM